MKWKYLLAQPLYQVTVDTETIERYLNRRGQEGWELVSVDGGVAYFKRSTEPIEFSGRLTRDVKGHPFKFTVRLGKENDD